MKTETRIILTALRNFLDRDDVKNRKVTAKMPNDVRLGDLSGKEVEVPLESFFQGLTHKVAFSDMAKTLDENNDIVCIFLEEFCNELSGYKPPVEDTNVSIEDKEKEVDNISKDLKGDSSEHKDE